MKTSLKKLLTLILITINLKSSFQLIMKNTTTLQSTQKLFESQNEETTPNKNPFFSLNECDLYTEGPICIFNGKKIILPNAEVKGLKLYYSFDQIRAIDESGNGNHANGNFFSGPSFTGIGNSAYFKDGLFLEIPDNKLYDNDFSFTFYLFILEDANSNEGERFCPFIHKGNDYNDKYERYPAILYDRQEKNLNIIIKTNNNDNKEGEKLISISKFYPQKWHHIALIKDNKKLSLYINGIPDNSIELKGDFENNYSNIYIGNTPLLTKNCKIPFYIDHLKIYNIPLNINYIQGEASPILGGIEPNFLRIGCLDCTLEKAKNSCEENYRLCTSLELHSAGFQIARNLGLLSWDTHLWTYSALENENSYSGLKGLVLCCEILK